MICNKCRFENPEHMNFCGKCGLPFHQPRAVCPECGFLSPPPFRFCGMCGTPLSAEENTGSKSSEHHPPEAERRQLTVMFCDLVGSTSLSEKLDPEELREVVQEYQVAGEAAVSRFGGHIAQYLGDGLLVYFGYPAAHEDDAQRAVRSGLGIIEEMEKLNGRLQRERRVSISVRVGIHTGLVVVGEMGGGEKKERLALGDTPNIAARVQGLAEPDTVLISSATERLARGFFKSQSVGAHSLKGVSRPMELYQIGGEVAFHGSVDAAVAGGLTPFVGREQEIRELSTCWKSVKKGEGRVALVAGEAGIGKSRLIRVFKEHIRQEPHTWMVCHCSSYYRNSAFYPITELIKRRLEFDPNESQAKKLTKLEAAVSRCGFNGDEVIPLFAPLLALPVPERYPPLTMTSRKQKESTLEAIWRWLSRISEEAPLVFLVENLQWSDPSTLEALSLIMDRGSGARLFVMITFRPQGEIPLGIGQDLMEIMLNRLSEKETGAMAERVAGGRPLPAEFLQQVVIKTDGVPLFVEELTKMVLEGGFMTDEGGRYTLSMPLSELAIPATLQDSLMARLDKLGSIKEVIQLAATLGREFSFDLISAVAPLDGPALKRELEHLVKAEILRRRDVQSEVRYSFNQALIQDAAYHSLLRKTRQKYHRDIAKAIVEHFTDIRENQPEIPAHHFTEAGLIEEAISYWLKAGKAASRQSAHLEAIHHLRKGLDLVHSLPESRERDRMELNLRIGLGLPMTATRGFASPDVEKVYARARVLCGQLGEEPRLFGVLRGLWLFYMVRAELERSKELGDQLLALAEEAGDPALLLQGHVSLGLTAFYLGRFQEARKHLERATAIYDRKQHHALAYIYGDDQGVVSLTYLAHLQWMLGRPVQATRLDQEAIQLADDISHPFSRALALNFRARLHQYRGDAKSTLEAAEACLDLSMGGGFTHWVTTGKILKGWALAHLEREEEGIPMIKDGLSGWKGIGAEVSGPYYLALLAEACRRSGQMEEALELVEGALRMAEKNQDRLYAPELHRLKGDLLLSLSDDSQTEAEHSFRAALHLAESQMTRPLEWRALTSLCRLLIDRGRTEEAKDIMRTRSEGIGEWGGIPEIRETKALF